jgi:hypothetical protein
MYSSKSLRNFAVAWLIWVVKAVLILREKYTDVFLGFLISLIIRLKHPVWSNVHLHGRPDPRLDGRVHPRMRIGCVVAGKVYLALGPGKVFLDVNVLEKDVHKCFKIYIMNNISLGRD